MLRTFHELYTGLHLGALAQYSPESFHYCGIVFVKGKGVVWDENTTILKDAGKQTIWVLMAMY